MSTQDDVQTLKALFGLAMTGVPSAERQVIFDEIVDRLAERLDKYEEGLRELRNKAMEDGYWLDAINSGDDQELVSLHARINGLLAEKVPE